MAGTGTVDPATPLGGLTMAAGATAIVAGSAIFGAKDYGAAIAAIRKSAADASMAKP